MLDQAGDPLAEGVVVHLLHGQEVALLPQQHDLRQHPFAEFSLKASTSISFRAILKSSQFFFQTLFRGK
jgi:hypothetical protein